VPLQHTVTSEKEAPTRATDPLPVAEEDIELITLCEDAGEKALFDCPGYGSQWQSIISLDNHRRHCEKYAKFLKCSRRLSLDSDRRHSKGYGGRQSLTSWNQGVVSTRFRFT
jgi:hypothetical protein